MAKRYATVDEVTDTVMAVFKIKDDIRKVKGVIVRYEKKSGARVYKPSYMTHRLIAMYFCRWYTDQRYRDISAKFGNKTNAAIVYSDSVIQGLIDIGDKNFVKEIGEIDFILGSSYKKRPEGFFYYDRPPGGMEMDTIIKMVQQEFDIDSDIRTDRGEGKKIKHVSLPNYHLPRMIAMSLCKTFTYNTNREIAHEFDVTTIGAVEYAAKVIRDLEFVRDKRYAPVIVKLRLRCIETLAAV